MCKSELHNIAALRGIMCTILDVHSAIVGISKDKQGRRIQYRDLAKDRLETGDEY